MMKIDLTRFNDPEYFEKLMAENKLEWNNHLMNEHICQEIKGSHKVWIYSDPIIQTEDNLDEVELNITGIRYCVSLCGDEGGYHLYFEDELSLHGSDYDKYFLYEKGVWHASRKTEKITDFYDTYYPVIFDRDTYGQNFFLPKFCSEPKLKEFQSNDEVFQKAKQSLSEEELGRLLAGW